MTLYQPFLDHAIATLESRLELTPYPIPEGFESKSAVTGKGDRQTTVLTESYGVQSTKLRQIRSAHVQGGGALQVLNFVIFPRLNYDLPFFWGGSRYVAGWSFDCDRHAAVVSDAGVPGEIFGPGDANF